MKLTLENMILLYVLSIISLTCAHEASELMKLDEGNELSQQDKIDALMRQVGRMEMLLANYRLAILSGIAEASDICDFIEKLAYRDELDDNKKNMNGNLTHESINNQINYKSKLSSSQIKWTTMTWASDYI